MIKNATFTSVWDNGIEVVSSCKVDTETKRCFDIEVVNVNGLDVLDNEYVTIDGEDYPVYDDDMGFRYE